MRIPAGIVAAHVGTNASVPTGWSRVTALDDRFPKQIPNNSTNPGSTGGSAAAHDHPYPQHSAHLYQGHNHSGSWGNTATHNPPTANASGLFNDVADVQSHFHATSSTATADITVANNSSGNVNTTAADPQHTTVIFITAGGTTTGIPVNAVVWNNATAPAGFSAYGSLGDRFMKGAATGADAGTQAGTPTHTHTSASHTHGLTSGHTHVVATLGPNTSILERVGSVGAANDTHVHTLGTSGGPDSEPTVTGATETSANGDFDPAWSKLRAIQKTGEPGVAVGIICIWLGTLATIPPGWRLCDGGGGTPNLSQSNYVKGAGSDGEIGNTGGAATHTHNGNLGHTHASSGNHVHSLTVASSDTQNGQAGIAGALNNMSTVTHTHASTTYTAPTVSGVGTSTNQANALSGNSSNDPVFTTVAYVQLKSTNMQNAFFEI